jgi:uncharacterized protein YlxP (DUF503 family)
MVQIGYLELEIDLASCTSLKDRRQIVQSLISKVRAKFNVSAADVSYSEYLSSAQIGITCVSNSADFTSRVIDKVEQFVEHTFPELLQGSDRLLIDPSMA